jgi:hypothetical protein
MLRLGSAQPCRYSHYDLRIDLMTNPINRALTAFDELIAAWLGPAAQRFVFTSGNTHAERVREAIRTVAKADEDDRRIGYGVFSKAPNIKREAAYDYDLISAVLDDLAQAQNAHEYATKQRVGEFVICEIQEVRE